jgi:Na+/proline symporter
LSITFIVMPLALQLVGGFDRLVDGLPAISFDQTYNGVHYTEHWLISIFIIMGLGTAAGGAQRFYSVKDERDAKRVGKLAGGLFVTVPLVFGIPPLVARVIWPDLSQVDFFKPYAGSNPQDLVFIGLCLKLLPNGLIGVFLAAMLAATMSALSSVYNMVSSILTRDVYQGVFRPETTDEEQLKVGRLFSITIGLIVTGLAVLFVNSQFGIFNLMQVFFTLLNIPVVVPVAFGLLMRRVPKWAAVGAIVWGLIVGIATRYVAGWDIGPQVYAAFLFSLGIFAMSYRVGRWYVEKWTGRLVGMAVIVGAGSAVLFAVTAEAGAAEWRLFVGVALGLVLGLSCFPLARMFASETEEERKAVEEFFRKLDTPVNVAKEVFGAGKKQVSTFPLVGGTTIVMGMMMALIFLTDLPEGEARILVVMVTIMILFGVLMWYFGKKSEIRSASQYSRDDGGPGPGG